MRSLDHFEWLRADKDHVWHPFTDHLDWCSEDHEPLILVKGEGVYLEDSKGRRYIDANSSIWTNIHGHAHPAITKAIQEQAAKVAHTSYLGFANPRASELAERLVSYFPQNSLSRVFFSDNGSTAVECALKMAIQYRQIRGESERKRFMAFHNGYHGDTMGAASLGGVSMFFERFRSFGLSVDFVSSLEELQQIGVDELNSLAGVIVEPLVQGVNQMHVWPKGMLKELREWCDRHDIHLILDEVMTGFGRTGTMFACQQENVIPDFLCLAKGLTGGYLPLAATLTSEGVFKEFQGSGDRTFYYGHSYTANQLGCAAALANLDVFEREQTLKNVSDRSLQLEKGLAALKKEHGYVISVRQCGLVAGVQIGDSEGRAFDQKRKMGVKFCEALSKEGVLTRPVLDTIVIMPPLSISVEELNELLQKISFVLSSQNY